MSVWWRLHMPLSLLPVLSLESTQRVAANTYEGSQRRGQQKILSERDAALESARKGRAAELVREQEYAEREEISKKLPLQDEIQELLRLKNPSARRSSPCKDDIRANGPLSRLELIVKMYHGDTGNFWNNLAPSLALFAPELPIVAVFEDTPANRAVGASLPIGYRTHYTNICDHWVKKYSCVLWYLDLFTDAEYVGAIETDAVLTTYVTEASLFQGVRPRLLAEVGRHRRGYAYYYRKTASILKRPVDLECFTYLPLVYWRKHIPLARAHIEHVHGSDFESIVASFGGGLTPEENCFCNYFLKEHPGMYSWHIQEVTLGWRGPLLPGQQNVTKTMALLSPRTWKPAVHVAIHGGHLGFSGRDKFGGAAWTKCDLAPPLQCPWFRILALKILGGFCRSLGAQGYAPKDLCVHEALTLGATLQQDLFRFEDLLEFGYGKRNTHQGHYIVAQQSHYREVASNCHGPNEGTMRGLLEYSGLSIESLHKDPAFDLLASMLWEDAEMEAQPYSGRAMARSPGRIIPRKRCIGGVLDKDGEGRVCCASICGKCATGDCEHLPGGFPNCCAWGFRSIPCRTVRGPPPCIYPAYWEFNMSDAVRKFNGRIASW